MDGATSSVKVVIHNRRFWKRFPDGRMERIYINAKQKGALAQASAMRAREGDEE
jgi:hypothetical protein